MERTTKFFLLDDTSKALKNQGFSEKQFQSGHSFSSQPRYDHFDTAAYIFRNISPQKHLGKRRELMERTTKFFLLDDTSKALKNQGFSEKQFQSGHSFSSQGRYNHFDTAAYLHKIPHF